MATQLPSGISASPLAPLFESWVDEKTSVYVLDGKISVLKDPNATPSKIQNSVKAVAQLIQKFDFPSGLDIMELIRLRCNIQQLNLRIGAYNTSIEQSIVWSIIDFVRRFMGFEGLKSEFLPSSLYYETVKAIDKQKEDFIEKLIENPELLSTHPKLPELLYLLTKTQKIAYHKDTKTEKIDLAILKKALHKLKTFYRSAEGCGLDRVTAFKVALFIESNRTLLANSTLGTPSKSRGRLGVRRVKPSDDGIPFLMEYNTQTKEIFIYIKHLPKGAYKKPKCLIEYENESVLVMAKVTNEKHMETPRFEKLAQNEGKLMEELKDEPHIVQGSLLPAYHSKKKHKEVFPFVMKYSNQGSLMELFDEVSLTFHDKLVIAQDILLGILELRKHKIIHRDIKPENIFVERVRDAQNIFHYHAVIGDLGLAVKKENTYELKQKVGTPTFQPPEIQQKRTASEASDLWALGLTLYKLFTGERLIKEKESEVKLQREIMHLSDDLPYANEASEDSKVINAILGFLKFVPEERSKPEDVLGVIKTALDETNS